MHRAGRSIVAAGIAAILVAVIAGPAAAKTVSPERYARSLCGLLDGGNEYVDAYNAIATDDPVAFQAEVVQLTDDYVADLQAGEAKLKKLAPDIKGGKKVSKLFVGYVDDIVTEVQDALDTFAAADPNGIVFTADVATFQVAVSLISTTVDDAFAEVTNQDLLKALEEEPSCEDVVTVI
jgi:hypothetical protein